MRVELFGLTMEAPGATFYLWSPWRCSFLEHKLFESLKSVPNATAEPGPDELRIHVADAKGWKLAVQNLSRCSRAGRRSRATSAAKSGGRGAGCSKPTSM